MCFRGMSVFRGIAVFVGTTVFRGIAVFAEDSLRGVACVLQGCQSLEELQSLLRRQSSEAVFLGDDSL
jgi:hypothetical protein